MSETVAPPPESPLAEAARRVPAAFYQFRLFPSGAFAIPFASPDFAARLGVPLGDPEATANLFFSHVHSDDVPRIKDEIARSARTLELFESAFRFRLPSGAELWIEARSNPERAPDGGVIWNGIATDLTARKEAETALRESEERLRLFILHAPAALAMFDRDMRYMAVSRRWLSDYGLEGRDIIGLSHYEVLPEVSEKWRAAHRQGLAGEVVRAEEDRFERADGSVQWLHWEIRPWWTDDRQVGGIVIFAEDVTEKKVADAKLRSSEERFRAIFDLAPVGVAQADPATGRWVAVNPRMCLITGYAADELLTMRVSDITHPEDRSRDWALFQDVVKGDAPEYRIEKRYVRKDGSTAWVNVNMVVLRDAAGLPVRTLAMIEDISERRKAEEALRSSEERFRVIFDVAPVGVTQADLSTGRLLAVNPRMTHITGYSEKELLGMTVADVTHPDDRQRNRDMFESLLNGGVDESRIEKRHVRKDGTIAWVNAHVVVLRNAAGRPNGTLATIEDITERKAAEADVARLNTELEDALNWQRQIFEGSRDAVFLSDDAGRFVAVNNAATELTGYSREELLAMAIPDLHDDSDLAAYRAFHRRILDGEQILSEAPIRRKDGGKVSVEFNNSAVVIGGKCLVHTAGRDVTERARAAGALAASEARYRALFENATEGIVAIDPETHRSLFHNPAVCAMFGYSPEEFSRLDLGDLHPKEELPGIFAGIRSAGQGARQGAHIVRCIRKDGSTFQADIRGTRVLTEGRAVVFALFTDVTERLHLEEQLRQSQKMEAIGQLAGGVAHDFNNLLTVISGNCDLLLSDAPREDAKRGPLEDIRAAGARAASLTRQLLAFSRKQILDPKLVDVNEIVTGIEKMLRRLIGEDVDLSTELAADPSWVKVDAGQLEQVIMNLAVNARDAMPRGGRLTLRTRNVDPDPRAVSGKPPDPRPLPGVVLSISDTGSGIPPEVMAHLFEPFFTTKGVGKGTGLGLATVYGIVKQSDGDITVESTPGKGTTFSIVLPSHPAPSRARAPGGKREALPRGTETILVVEDEDAVRRIVKVTLETAGYRVIEARNGSEALDATRRHAREFDLLVTDVVMPEMSGRELVERLTAEHSNLSVLFMSGYTDDAVVRHGVFEEGVAFLQKPFTPLALAKKVREVLDAAL